MNVYEIWVEVSEVLSMHIDILLNLLSVLRKHFFLLLSQLFMVPDGYLFNLFLSDDTFINETFLVSKEMIGDLVVALVE